MQVPRMLAFVISSTKPQRARTPSSGTTTGSHSFHLAISNSRRGELLFQIVAMHSFSSFSATWNMCLTHSYLVHFRTDGRAPTPPQTFPSRNAKKVLQNKRPVNRNHIPLSPRINITHNGSTKLNHNELIKTEEDDELDYYYDSNETKANDKNRNNQLYLEPTYYEDITPSSIRPPRKQVVIRRQKLDNVNTATPTTPKESTTVGQLELEDLEDNDPQIITGSSEDYDLDYIVPPKVISTTEAPRVTTAPSTQATTTPQPRTRPTTTIPATTTTEETTTTRSTEAPKVFEDHTVILTSGFYLPKETEEEADEHVGDVSTEPVQKVDRTTEDAAGYEDEYYEYEEDAEEENIPEITTAAPVTRKPAPGKASKSADRILGEQVVQVVTTKSVVNGTTVTNKPNTATTPQDKTRTTTEGYVVVASVQTSRSVSGARFLPFPQVEQEEKKQSLTELEKLSEEEEQRDALLKDSYDHAKDIEFDITTPSTIETSTNSNKAHSTSTNIPVPPAQSTESIIDKLDRVQSELSSGVLSGNFPVLDDPAESTTVRPGQVVIKKFTPRTTTYKPIITTTPKKPEIKKFQVETTTPDELESLLPPGYKQKYSSFKKKLPASTEPTVTEVKTENSTRNPAIARSYKNGKIGAQELNVPGFSSSKGRVVNNPETATTTQANVKTSDSFEALLPKDFKAKTKNASSLLERAQKVDLLSFLPPGFKLDQGNDEIKKVPEVVIETDLSKFLPPGYKPPADEPSPPAVIPLAKDEIGKFLPPGYKPEAAVESTTEKKLVTVVEDNSKFLPPGFKVPKYGNRKESSSTPAPVEEKKLESILDKVQFKDVSALLPPGFKPPTEESSTASPVDTTTANSAGKVVFPSRPGFAKKPGQRPVPHKSAGPPPPVIGIRKGPPTRATTEFTGWPSAPTTPLSIEKILLQQNAQAIDLSELLKGVTTSTTPSTTTVRHTTSTTTAKPTKPGLCRRECDLAGTIKLVDGIKWRPEYLDHNTQEWKSLAKDVETELNEVYSKSRDLKKWFRKVRIDSFSKGSVLVDFFVELNNITGTVDTLDIKRMFHESLRPRQVDMQSDDPAPGLDDDATFDRIVEQRSGKETYLLGRYVVDPVSTDFIGKNRNWTSFNLIADH